MKILVEKLKEFKKKLNEIVKKVKVSPTRVGFYCQKNRPKNKPTKSFFGLTLKFLAKN